MHRSGWYKIALEIIEKLVRSQRFITSDEIHEELERLGKECPGDWDLDESNQAVRSHSGGCCAQYGRKFTPPHPNAMGAVFREASSQGLIKMVNTHAVPSRRPSRRGSRITVWESHLYRKRDESAEDYVQRREEEFRGNQQSLLA